MRTRIGILFNGNTGRVEILGVKKRARNPEAFASVDNRDDSIRGGSLLVTSKNIQRNSPLHSGLRGKQIVNGLP